ncbi:hypothetical protein EVAR_33433_1 [Eumeta japonica]|uniref:Uncharacterized protein n=1 Tax=Eumeta variegata TaxID=151549 RepID=A0A4C1W4H2_EUMVA|nr:hypothetical protein EVAR_33433_1 [Eumeta japonica]
MEEGSLNSSKGYEVSNWSSEQTGHEDGARFSDTSWQIHRTWAREGGGLPISPPAARAPPADDSTGIYDTITQQERRRNIKNPTPIRTENITPVIAGDKAGRGRAV